MSEQYRLDEMLHYAYENETNVQINSFWDNGYDVKIGDDMNGYSHEMNFAKDEIFKIGKWIYDSLQDRYNQLETNGRVAIRAND